MKFLLIVMLFSSPDSCRCDSLRYVCDSLVKEQAYEIRDLRSMLQRRDDEIMLQQKIGLLKDTMHVGFFHDLQFELEEQRRMQKTRENYFVIGWAVIAVTAILFGKIKL